MATLAELESEALGELELESEDELEGELEDELEGELESEEVLSQLAALAQRAMRSPTLQRAVLGGARGALSGLADGIPAQEGEFELEGEDFTNPLRRVYTDALMEHLGHAAMTAESEAEAEEFIGALLPLAANLLPKVAPLIMRAAPKLIRGATRVARVLRRSPRTRPLVRTLPTIVRRTATTLAKQAARGQSVTPRSASRTMARQAAQVLASPSQCARVWQRSRALDRRYHRTSAGTSIGTGTRVGSCTCGCCGR